VRGASVTKRACEACGVELVQPATGRRRTTCSGACRQKAFRKRHAPRPVRLTAELREFLRREVDRRTRARLAAADAEAGLVRLDEWRKRAA
jgi:uncharacterized Zn finger protein (UPF0148 family)